MKQRHTIQRKDGTIFGFTLVEILVVIAVLGTLLAGIVFTINPFRQISKAQNAVRQQNLQEIKKALDIYYHDKTCYPHGSESIFVNSLENGEEWREGNTIYMKEVPRDPATDEFFRYIADSTNQDCPQWYVLMGQLDNTSLGDVPEGSARCSLPVGNQCSPVDYDESWACVTAGNVTQNAACEQLSQVAIDPANVTPSPTQPVQSENATPTVTPGGGGTSPSPTASASPTLPMQGESFAVAMNTDPYFYTGTVTPFNTVAGGSQEIQIVARTGVLGQGIASVSATIKIGAQALNTYQFQLISGTVSNGTWRGTWNVPAHLNGALGVTLTAIRADGAQASTDLSLP